MGIEFDYDFETVEILVHDAPKGSAVIVDGVKYVPERTCDGCVYDLPNGMSADPCLICVRNAPDMYKKVCEVNG